MFDPNLHVWLTYVSYPVTTAAYLERALRKICRVTTVGPKLPGELIDGWNLHNMKVPVLPHDIDTPGMPDLQELIAALPVQQHPDLFIWVESVGRELPKGLNALSCPKACYLIDSHLNLSKHLEIAPSFDHVFIAQLEYLKEFRKYNTNSHWLPLACDPDVHGNKQQDKIHDLCFVGSVNAETRRAKLLDMLRSELPVHFERCFWHEMAEVFSASKIVFNEAVNHDLNMRFFEALSSGSLLLSDLARNSGQEILFRDGEDYACYDENHLVATARFYLENQQLREQIAARGKAFAHNAHTYHHRASDLLDVVMHDKQDTFSPEELRERSLVGLVEPSLIARESITTSSASRSFVIPVLDYSPASEYSIITLLDDLEQIPGDVIVIFNSEDVADKLKHHPRITHYAVMKLNIGVARAWNVGLDIAETPTVFIVNADAHITPEGVNTLEQNLWQLDRAACVGPQGSFLNVGLCSDYHYFDKGTFDRPVAVDSVSGFFFCVKRTLFEDKTLQFENCFTPCYFEEWDLGLQIRKAGLMSYVVPTTAYDHHWSGTIRALNTIPYYGREETASNILKRNRMLFLLKWRGIMRRENAEWLLESGWKRYAMEEAGRLMDIGEYVNATDLFDKLAYDFPEDREVTKMNRFVSLLFSKISAT